MRSRKDVDAALVKNEVGARNRRSAAAELAVEADRRAAEVFHQQRGPAIDDARMPVVGPHPVGRVGCAARLKADGVCRCLILRLPVERVVVAAVAEMKETSRGRKKIEGSFRISAGALEDSARCRGHSLVSLQVEEQRKPDCQVIVAQTAGTLLQVRFEMKDGVAVLGVAGAGDLAQLLGNGVPLAQNEAGKDRLMKLLVKRELPSQKATVKRGQGELEVVGIEFSSFFDGPRTRDWLSARCPTCLE